MSNRQTPMRVRILERDLVGLSLGDLPERSVTAFLQIVVRDAVKSGRAQQILDLMTHVGPKPTGVSEPIARRPQAAPVRPSQARGATEHQGESRPESVAPADVATTPTQVAETPAGAPVSSSTSGAVDAHEADEESTQLVADGDATVATSKPPANVLRGFFGDKDR